MSENLHKKERQLTSNTKDSEMDITCLHLSQLYRKHWFVVKYYWTSYSFLFSLFEFELTVTHVWIKFLLLMMNCLHCAI